MACDQDIDALERAQLADKQEIGRVFPGSHRFELGGADPIMDHARQRLRFADLGEEVSRPKELSNRNRSVRGIRSRSSER